MKHRLDGEQLEKHRWNKKFDMTVRSTIVPCGTRHADHSVAIFPNIPNSRRFSFWTRVPLVMGINNGPVPLNSSAVIISKS